MTQPMSATIGGATPTIVHGSLKASQDIGRRSTADFTAVDTTLSNHYQWGNPVVVYDNLGNKIFSGFVDTDDETLTGNPEGWAMEHAVVAADNHYRSDKRQAAKTYSNMVAGDIVSDLVNTYLTVEGVIGCHLYKTIDSQTDWGTQTLTRVQTTSNHTGDIELASVPSGPTFARASVAYLNGGGTSVASGVVRYETFNGKVGAWFEEACTNLLSANQSDVETNTTGFQTTASTNIATGATITQDATHIYFNTKALKVATAGGTANQGVETTGISASANTKYSASVWVWVATGTNVRVMFRDYTNSVSGTDVTLTGNSAWQRATITLTTGGTAVTDLRIGARIDSTTAGTFWLDGLQIEAKPFSTNWQVAGTNRSAETLSIPAAAYNVTGGGWAGWVYVNAALLDRTATKFIIDARLNSAQSNNIILQHTTGGNWNLQVQNATATTSISYADSNTPVGWHRFMITWGSSGATLYIDGVQAIHSATANLPSSVDTTALGVRFALNTGQCDTMLSDCKWFGRQLTSTDASNDYTAAQSGPVGPDQDTTYYLSLQSNLLVGYGGYSLYTYDISKIGNVASGVVSYTKSSIANTTSKFETSINGGATWVNHASGGSMSELVGQDTSDGVHGSLMVRCDLWTTDTTLSTPYFDSYTLTIKTSQIQDGPTVVASTFNYAPCADCIQSLADKSAFIWFIDQFVHLWFFAPGAISGPTITSASMVDDTIKVTRTNPIYRNRQFITGINATTSSQTETRKGDGTTKAFTMSYPLAATPTITVNGVSKTVGIKGVNTSGFDWYWALGDPVLAQDNAGTTLISTDTLSVTYTGQYTAIVQSDDSAQQAAQQAVEGGGTTGIVEASEAAPAVASVTEAIQLANGKLARFSKTGKQVTFATQTTGFAPGQLATVTIAEHGINGEQMLVESVQIADHMYDDHDFTVTYTIVAVEGPANTTWADFFNNLINKGSNYIDSISLGAQGTLVTSVPITETWPTWGETVTVTAYSCPLVGTALVGSANVC